jgi:vesicular inhibitory amino acid transporter
LLGLLPLQVAYLLFSGSFVPGACTDLALWSSVPLVFGIMTFCYSGHGVFPSIQASMKNPQEFPKESHAALP